MATIRVTFSAQVDGVFILLPTTELEVTAGDAAAHGLIDEPDPDGVPVVLDAVVEAHKLVVGSAFSTETCSKFLQMQHQHWLGLAFGKRAHYSGYTINGFYAYDLSSTYTKQGYKGLSFDKARIYEGDAIEVFAFQDSFGMDYYSYFMRDGERIMELELAVGEAAELKLEGLMYGYGGPMTRSDRITHHLVSPVTEAQLVTVDPSTGLMMPIKGAITDEEEGDVSFSFDEPGEYYISSIGGEVRYNAQIVFPWLKVVVR